MAKNMTLSEMSQLIEDRAAARGLGIIDVDFSIAADSAPAGALTPQEDRREAQSLTHGCFIPGCTTELCSECDLQACAELAQVEAQMMADWRDDFESQARPGSF